MTGRIGTSAIQGYVNRAYRQVRAKDVAAVSDMQVEIRSLARIAGDPMPDVPSLPGRTARTRVFDHDVFLYADDGGPFEPNASTFKMDTARKIVGSMSRFCLPSPDTIRIDGARDGRPILDVDAPGNDRTIFVRIGSSNYVICLGDPLCIVAGALRLLQTSPIPETRLQAETLAPLVDAMGLTSWTARSLNPFRAADHAVAREILSGRSDRFLSDRRLDFSAICERVEEVRSRFETDADLADLCTRTNVPFDAWSIAENGLPTLRLSSVTMPPGTQLALPTPQPENSGTSRRMGSFDVSATEIDGKDVLVVARRAQGTTSPTIRPIPVRAGRLARASVVRYVHAQTASRPLRKAAFLAAMEAEGTDFPLEHARPARVRGEDVLAVPARPGSPTIDLPDISSLLPVLGTEDLAVVDDGTIDLGTFAHEGIHAGDVALFLDDGCILLTGRPDATVSRLYAATSPDHCSRPVTENECEAALEILGSTSFTPDEAAAMLVVEAPSR